MRIGVTDRTTNVLRSMGRLQARQGYGFRVDLSVPGGRVYWDKTRPDDEVFPLEGQRLIFDFATACRCANRVLDFNGSALVIVDPD